MLTKIYNTFFLVTKIFLGFEKVTKNNLNIVIFHQVYDKNIDDKIVLSQDYLTVRMVYFCYVSFLIKFGVIRR